jgi:uncharacterized delta-60 repeat protein
MIGLSIRNPGFLAALASSKLKLDTTFNFTPISGLNAYVETLGFQSDGKIILGGNFRGSIGSVSTQRIYRLNTDGSVDPSFVVRDGNGFSNVVKKVFVLPDDKILVSGFYTAFNVPQNENGITLLDSNGQINTGTNLSGFQGGGAIAIERQSDGKLILGGTFTRYGNTNLKRLVRLNSGYTIDEDFLTNMGTGLSVTGNSPYNGFSNVQDLKIQADGKILVVGRFTQFNGVSQNNITRLNADGTLDTTFANNIGTGTGLSAIPDGSAPIIHTVNIQNDGKILIGGIFTTFNGSSASGLVRLNSDGTRDSSFNDLSESVVTLVNGATFYPKLEYNHSVLPLSNGDILFAGYFPKQGTNLYSPDSWSLGLSNSDGSSKTIIKKLGSFNIGPSHTSNARVYSVFNQADGKIYVSFTDGINNYYLYRFLPIE